MAQRFGGEGGDEQADQSAPEEQAAGETVGLLPGQLALRLQGVRTPTKALGATLPITAPMTTNRAQAAVSTRWLPPSAEGLDEAGLCTAILIR